MGMRILTVVGCGGVDSNTLSKKCRVTGPAVNKRARCENI